MNDHCVRNRTIHRLLLLFFVHAVLVAGTTLAQGTAPNIWLLLPDSVTAGKPAFTLTVVGNPFPQGSVVNWNGEARPTTLFASGVLEARISEIDIRVPTIAQITVSTPDGSTSNALPFTAKTSNPAPVVDRLSPSRAVTGDPGFTLTIFGHGFNEQCVVMWGGSSRVTTFITSEILTAEIDASDILEPGNVAVTVQDFTPGGGTSAAAIFVVSPFHTQLYFPQFAVGGGYRTDVTLVNNGTEDGFVFLTLTAPNGEPLAVHCVRSADPPEDFGTDSVFFLGIPAGGSRILLLDSPDGSSQVLGGWARVDSTASKLSGIATFQRIQDATTTALAGVLPSAPIFSGTVPINNSSDPDRQMGFAIANPGLNPVNIQATVLDEEGIAIDTVSPPQLNPLPPGHQIAQYFWELMPQYKDFRGTVVFSTSDLDFGFSAVALSFYQGQMTIVPVIVN